MGNGNDTGMRADIAVIGGGAAGLAAAIAAAEAGEGAVRVTVCEAADRAGKPILATGNGRCNFSNARLLGASRADLALWYRNAGFAARALAAAESALPGEGGNAALRFFADHGLVWREESEGRLYPLANKASSVLDVLRAAADAAGVAFELDFPVTAIERAGGGASARFRVESADSRGLFADRVIVTTGGAGDAALLENLGVPMVPRRPVLGPLAVRDKDKRVVKRLDNIRVKAAATLLRGGEPVRIERGEVLFRAYGLSGIAVFDLSRDALPGDEIALDLLPDLAAAETLPFLEERAARLHERTGCAPACDDVLRGMVLPQVAQLLCERAGVRGRDAVDSVKLDHLARVLHGARFTMEGIGDARQCQVHRGGAATEALDPATLEAKDVPGLHIAGEAVDVDGACGGFNLHWAWTSGLLAGRAAARAALASKTRGAVG